MKVIKMIRFLDPVKTLWVPIERPGSQIKVFQAIGRPLGFEAESQLKMKNEPAAGKNSITAQPRVSGAKSRPAQSLVIPAIRPAAS